MNFDEFKKDKIVDSRGELLSYIITNINKLLRKTVMLCNLSPMKSLVCITKVNSKNI